MARPHKDIDAEFDAVLAVMQREASAALDCDEFEAGALSMKRGNEKLYELMCEKFGPDWLCGKKR